MKVYHLSAFTMNQKGGNKAAVVLDANNLNVDQKQMLARQIGYSETAFVFPLSSDMFLMEYFTPNSEIDLCGHATIASFSLLKQINLISNGTYKIKTKAGLLRVDVCDDFVFMKQNTPRYLDILSESDIANCFNHTSFINKGTPIQVVSTGLKEIFVPVKDVKTLNGLEANIDVIKEVSKKFGVIGMHLFALGEDADAYSRNFAPLVGIDEESATGTSNGALACYLFKHYQKKDIYDLRQGYAMNLPSQIIVKIVSNDLAIEEVLVGGTAAIIKEKDDE